jgi:DNA modification methylase
VALGSGEEALSWEIKQGDCLAVLKTMADESVHCVVTSPPYWGLRDYGVEGQLGLEKTPEEYIAKMVEIFREVRRVLRSDGTLWLNMGDSYAASGRGGGGGSFQDGDVGTKVSGANNRRAPAYGYKPKDLVGVPWMLAFALRSDGWWLRSDIIWHKPNPMPESVTDRPTKAHEYIFLLSKSEKYFYDAAAIKEPVTGNAHERGDGVNPKAKKFGQHSRIRQDQDPRHLRYPRNRQNESFSAAVNGLVLDRNKRSVWSVATSPFPEAHFATFPPKLIEPCILAGTSERGCCEKCGAPLKRQLESETLHRSGSGVSGTAPVGKLAGGSQVRAGHDVRLGPTAKTQTTGWEATCDCQVAEINTRGAKAQKIFRAPCVVLDLFSGAGTTGLVARRLQRRYIGIELNPEYIAMSQRRITDDQPLFNTVTA